MACIDKIYSVSALVGSHKCNANCSFCAAKQLREDAVLDGMMPDTFKSALKLSARYGGWSLSLTGSGEPTCSPDAVTNALKDYSDVALEGAFFPNVNLFTNGILIADNEFCDYYLPIWKRFGLTAIAVSIHSATSSGQALAYGLESYPSLRKIFDNIKKYGLQCRVTLLLRRGDIDNWRLYRDSLIRLRELGVQNITSWRIANPDGTRNEYTPSRWNMLGIRAWLKLRTKLCHGHVWGGGVYDYNGMMVRLTDYVSRHSPRNDYVRQLVVFQDGMVAYSWIKEGAICMLP